MWTLFGELSYWTNKQTSGEAPQSFVTVLIGKPYRSTSLSKVRPAAEWCLHVPLFLMRSYFLRIMKVKYRNLWSGCDNWNWRRFEMKVHCQMLDFTCISFMMSFCIQIAKFHSCWQAVDNSQQHTTNNGRLLCAKTMQSKKMFKAQQKANRWTTTNNGGGEEYMQQDD